MHITVKLIGLRLAISSFFNMIACLAQLLHIKNRIKLLPVVNDGKCSSSCFTGIEESSFPKLLDIKLLYDKLRVIEIELSDKWKMFPPTEILQ